MNVVAQMQLLVMIVILMVLLGTGVVFFMVQAGTIQSRKIVTGAAVLLALSGIVLTVVAVQDSAARAESNEHIGSN